jgi:hypothetical protein
MSMINIQALPGYVDESKPPVFGKVPQRDVKIVHPVNEINYNIDGCPILWINCSTPDEAVEYYRKNFPLIPFCDQIAIIDFHRKIDYLNKMSGEDIQ